METHPSPKYAAGHPPVRFYIFMIGLLVSRRTDPGRKKRALFIMLNKNAQYVQKYRFDIV